eukprot:946731-Pyramimonas_sp.AAC.1
MRQCPSSAPPVPGSLAAAASWGSTHVESFDIEVNAPRIKWDYSHTFDPAPFLPDPIVRWAFLDPDVTGRSRAGPQGTR